MNESKINLIVLIILFIIIITSAILYAYSDSKKVEGDCYDRFYNKINGVTCEVTEHSLLGEISGVILVCSTIFAVLIIISYPLWELI